MAGINIKIVFGGGIFDSQVGYNADLTADILNVLEKEGVKYIDTAATYGESEEWMGQAHAASRFIIDTKYPGGQKMNPTTKEDVIQVAEESLRKPKADSVDVLYIHAPDRNIEQALAGIDALYRAGKFKRFGLSQFNAADVEETIRICQGKGYVLPSVYQGNYNAVARRTETELIPILRKYNIPFYAYSPIAGGFLAKPPEQIINGKGRWDPDTLYGKMYQAMYNQPAMMAALVEFGKIAQDAGMSRVELAYRWIAFNSSLKPGLGDAVVIGPRTIPQLHEVLSALRKGPLDEQIASKVNALWNGVEQESPLDVWSAYTSALFAPKQQ